MSVPSTALNKKPKKVVSVHSLCHRTAVISQVFANWFKCPISSLMSHDRKRYAICWTSFFFYIFSWIVFIRLSWNKKQFILVKWGGKMTLQLETMKNEKNNLKHQEFVISLHWTVIRLFFSKLSCRNSLLSRTFWFSYSIAFFWILNYVGKSTKLPIR